MYGTKNCKRQILISITALVFLLYILNFREMNLFSLFRIKRKGFLSEFYIVNTTGCRIPYLDVYDEEIMSLMSEVSDYKCSNKAPLVTSNLTALTIDRNVFEQYGITSSGEVNCLYKPFWRVDPKGEEADHEVAYGKPVYFNTSVIVTEEFVRVDCHYNNDKYSDFHSFVPVKKTKVDSKRDEHDDNLNIIMMGTDSISRLHLHRKMSKTVKYLLEGLKAIEFFGYNKVADNTFPNLMPIFSGYSFEELIKVCWPSYQTKFDNCSFVWQNYSNAGYVTSIAEEKSSFGLFNYLKKGWFKQPTDYYWKTFDYTALEEIGHNYDITHSYPDCMGPRPMYKVLLNNAEKFITTMKNNRFFTFYWDTTLAHDDYDTATLGDEDYVQHLNFLNNSGILNRSMLIFLSDHGYRFGELARTHQGHLEERLPYIFFVLPSWFQKRYSTAVYNLKQNAFRLTSPFDVHATLNHILKPSEITNEKLYKKEAPDERTISLFLPIPLKRTCDTAGIPPHWCTCQESLPVDKTDPVVLSVVKYSTEYINSLLKNYNNCSILQLDEITDANLAKYGDTFHSVQSTISDYTVSFKTSPGGGWFDVTVRCTFCTPSDFQIAGTISRLNRYDNQSYCISDFNLKLYCYCKYQLA